MSDRCEMLLSPGTVTLSDRAGAAVNVIGRGGSAAAVTVRPVWSGGKKCARLLTARLGYGKARDVSWATAVAPRKVYLSI